MTATSHRTDRPVGTPVAETAPRRGARTAAVVRLAMGFLFLWPFADKLLGLGYATPAGKGWIDGGSPTRGFLSGLDHGPLADTMGSWAGQPWADWLFMLGLLGVGLALVAGVGLRVAAAAGTVMMALMWVAEWPPARFTGTGEATRSTNPFLDYHVVYALVLILLAAVAAGGTWGLGRAWARVNVVRANPWLR